MTTFDTIDGETFVRIAGTQAAVLAEMNRIQAIGAWVWFVGPVLWGDEFVAHGVVRDLTSGL